MNEILLIIAILPIILLGIFIYKKDKKKEPKPLLAKLFISGILSCLIVILVSILLSFIFPFINKKTIDMNYFEFTIYVFIFIALVEETFKWIMTYTLGYKSKEYDEVYDIIVYAVFVSLGFASLENILYVFDIGSIQLGIFRGITAIPGHVCDAIAMGYYLSLANYYKKENKYDLVKSNKIKSIVIPTIYHGIYDYCLLVGSNILLIFFILYITFLYYISLKRIKQLSN